MGRAVARALFAAALALPAGAMAASDPGLPRAPRMQFVAPPAGTYALQHIQASPDAPLLDSSAQPCRLSDLTHGKITLLTFFYTHCTDPLGCPFALGLMSGLRERIGAEPDLRRNVRFVSISFDPTRDSPGQLRSYARGLAAKARFEWDFVTAPSMAVLQPLLDDFGQDVRVERASDRRPARAMSHMLKLFLIDPDGSVREIYALDFLQPEVMLNDMRTLRLEQLRAVSR
ncbi:MAG TPA: SCO family protein [Burkholderiaceae bacterium]|nr:SCO family protein [Burkholderiaceae bacterium]